MLFFCGIIFVLKGLREKLYCSEKGNIVDIKTKAAHKRLKKVAQRLIQKLPKLNQENNKIER